jgi:hypothetical protein
MNLERVFESILRIYPKSFHDRFGEELKLGFQDEINAKPSKLEIAKLLGDTITSAIWERLQATKWIYWLLAISTVVFFLFSGITAIFPNTNDQIYEKIVSFTAFFSIATPLVFLMRLERVPSRLEWIGMLICYNPFLFLTGSNSVELGVWLAYVSSVGLGLFAISNQLTRGISLQVRSLKFGLGLMAILMCINNSIGLGRIFPHTASFAFTLRQFNLIFIVISISLVIFSLLWKPRPVLTSS